MSPHETSLDRLRREDQARVEAAIAGAYEAVRDGDEKLFLRSIQGLPGPALASVAYYAFTMACGWMGEARTWKARALERGWVP